MSDVVEAVVGRALDFVRDGQLDLLACDNAAALVANDIHTIYSTIDIRYTRTPKLHAQKQHPCCDAFPVLRGARTTALASGNDVHDMLKDVLNVIAGSSSRHSHGCSAFHDTETLLVFLLKKTWTCLVNFPRQNPSDPRPREDLVL